MKILETQSSNVIRNHSKNPAAAPVRFGCRVFAYVSSADYQGQDEFVRQCLLTGGNSMKRQSQLALEQAGDTQQTALKNFKGLEHDGGRKAGWGIAYVPFSPLGDAALGLTVEKSATPAWTDTNYDKVANLAANSHPKVLLTHLREAMWSHLQASEKKNAHPFQLGDWALMQHGDFPKAVNEGLEGRLKAWHAKDSTSPLPQGEVDSERIACYVAAKFQQQFGSDNISQQSTDQVRQVFQQTMGEVIRWPISAHAQKSSAHAVYPGTYNLVMSDGNRIFATHYNAHSKMLVGRHSNPAGQVEYLLSTDKIQPLPASGQKAIVWQEVPDNTLLTLERTRDKYGKTIATCVLEPLLPEGHSALYRVHTPALGQKPPRITFKELSQINVDESFLGRIRSLSNRLLQGMRHLTQTMLNWFKCHILRQKVD